MARTNRERTARSRAYEEAAVHGAYIQKLVRDLQSMIFHKDAPSVFKRKLKLHYTLTPAECVALQNGITAILRGQAFRQITLDVSSRRLHLALVR